MGAEDVFTATEAVDDCHDNIDAVHEKEQHPLERMGTPDELEEEEHLHEGDGNTADIAGKAPGIITEVEIEEHHDGHDHAHDQARVAEVDDRVVDIVEGNQVDERVHAGHAVDAVHEVEAVQGADADDEHQDDKPERMGIHPRVPHDHGECRDLGGDAQERVLAFDVVGEAGGGDYGGADNEPGEGKPVQGEPAKQGEDEDDPSAADGRRLV